MGLEPTIFCSVGRRVIHYATRLIVLTSIPIILLTPRLSPLAFLLYIAINHSSKSLYLTTNIRMKGSQSNNLICAVLPIQLSIVLNKLYYFN